MVTADARTDRPEPFRTERADEDAVQVLAVFGEIDIDTAPSLRVELQALHRDGPAVLDLCATGFMDSSGLAVLLDQARSFPAGVMHVACETRGPLSRLLRMAHADQALQVHANRDDAVAAARETGLR